MFAGSQRHINRLNDIAILRILRQHIICKLVRVEYRLAVKVVRRSRLYHDALFTEQELVYIAVICDINAFQNVNRVCIDRNAERNVIIKVVRDVQTINHKLPLVRTGMHNGWNFFKPRHACKAFFRQTFICDFENAVFDVVKAAFISLVDLQITIILTFYSGSAVERAFRDNAVLPCQRENVLYSHIINLNAVCCACNRLFAVRHCTDNTRNVCDRTQCRLHFLHLVRLYLEVVLFKDAVDERLFFLALQGDLHLFVHE